MSDKPDISISSNAWTTPEDHNSIQMQHLRSYPALAKCTQCQSVGFSKGERSINCTNCIFLCCCSLCWSCYMMYKWKDMNCLDMEHKCSGCGNALANYSAC